MTGQTTNPDPFAGVGGSYTVDPETGVKTRVEGTAPAPTAQELIDQQAAAEAEAAAAAAAAAAAQPSGRRSRASAEDPSAQS
jgi:hypothetical protein